MKKVICVLLLAVILSALLIACGGNGTEQNKFRENNILGLKDIKTEEESISLVFDKDSTKLYDSKDEWQNPVYIYAKYFDKERDMIKCKANGEFADTTDFTCEMKGENVYISFRCAQAENVTEIYFGEFVIKNPEEPELSYELSGGEVITIYTQEYDPETNAWLDYQEEEIYFSLEDE